MLIKSLNAVFIPSTCLCPPSVEENGSPAEKVNEILTARIENETVDLGKNRMSNFLYTYIMFFALYMVVLIYGNTPKLGTLLKTIKK